MRRFVVGFFAVIGALSLLVLVGVAGVIVAAWRFAAHQAALPDAIVLSADLDHGLAEGPAPGAVARVVFGDQTTLRDFLDALDRAGSDKRVKGLYARLGDDSLGLAKVQQVRAAIAAFRAKGKFAVAFADTFGEFGPGTRPYYLATAFDQVWLQPLGSVGLTGLYSEVPFLRDALGKIGVAARFDRRSEYKTVMNSLTDSAMPPPQREEIDGLLTSLDGQIVHDIAAARGLTEAQVRALIDRGPLLADEAKAAHLVDRLGYRDEAIGAARRRAGAGAMLVGLPRYLREAGRPNRSGATIALIYGTGLITREGTGGGALGANGLDAAKVAAAFRAAASDRNVRAIVFRIDSPGGSAVASETLWHEIERTRQRGKPVIVSMGDVAASGGYYIAAAADKIVAEPATLTGSIGVVAGKVVLSGLMQKLGIAVDSVQRGADAGMFSAMQDFSPAMQGRLDDMLDRTYQGFKNHVAAGRHLSPEAVEGIAKGRVWSGAQAKANGLVDALGGYSIALRLAREAAKVPAGAPIRLVVFPRPKGTVAEILARLSGDSTDGRGVSGTIGARVGAVLALYDRLAALAAAPGSLMMPPIGDVR